MDCKHYEELLFERLDRKLHATLASELRSHLARCERCTELASLLAGDNAATVVPADLADAILARTTGRDAPLLRAARQLERDLPALAEMQPDGAFVADVLAATVLAGRESFWVRAASFWQGLAQRPRLALESAYLGSLAIFLLVGLPASPLAGVPQQVATQLANENGIVRVSVRSGFERASIAGQETWSRAGDFFGAALPAGIEDWRFDATTTRSWRDSVTGLLDRIWQSTFQPAFDWLRRAWVTTFGGRSESPPLDETTHERNSISA